MQLSENFSLAEMCFSQTATRAGINNRPDGMVTARLRALCENVLQPLRDAVGAPIRVTSGYRSPVLNARIGGSATSQHRLGEAADIVLPADLDRDGVVRLYNIISASGLPFDQLILELGEWVHVSHRFDGRPRAQRLVGTRTPHGRIVYRPGRHVEV